MGVFTAGTTVLTKSRSLELLHGANLGRLAVAVGPTVEIFPVNYGVTSWDTVIFRTAPGSKLASIAVSPRVAFEVDHVEGDQAWSVIVHGHARLHAEAGALRFAEDLDVHPFVGGERYDVVEVVIDSITGRGFGRATE
jgi:nitroimidazol reductase NimA-like FMN-containing flavoprotein (pyridoxamine 5'-phosphate oxidase superfamily)